MPALTAEQETILRSLSREDSARAYAAVKRLRVQKDPFRLIEDGYLKISGADGVARPFILNKAQRKLHGILRKLWDENKVIRIIILKARKLGISTYVSAVEYALASQMHNQNNLVIAHDLDGSNNIFEMSKFFQDTCPEYLRPETKKSNEKKLEFEGINSRILIDTAQNKEAGRSFTFRAVHLSEKAFFPKRSADEIMLGLSHSVPPLPKTIIIQETTANGFGHFKDEWDKAVRGETDYVPIFIPWYWHEDYRMPVPDGFDLGDAALGDVTKDEVALHQQMSDEGIDNIHERLVWRRWDIRNNCKGDPETFNQENPSTPEEAFIASGKCFFDKRVLAKQLRLAGVPLFRANIVKENFKFVLRKCDDGDFAFYEDPMAHGQYCIGGDACSGSGTDFAPLVARNKATNAIVCIYHAKCDPDELAFRAMLLGNLLNQAVVAIENDKFGFAANQKLRTIYGNVYIQRTFNKIENKPVEKIGWDTNAVTRPMMLGQMQEEIREGSLQLKDQRLIRECLTFIQNPETRKAEAEAGENDDLVMACAISGILRREDPYRIPPERPTGRDVPVDERNAGLSFRRRT